MNDVEAKIEFLFLAFAFVLSILYTGCGTFRRLLLVKQPLVFPNYRQKAEANYRRELKWTKFTVIWFSFLCLFSIVLNPEFLVDHIRLFGAILILILADGYEVIQWRKMARLPRQKG